MPLNPPATTSYEGSAPPVTGQVTTGANDVRLQSQAVIDMAVNWDKVTTLLGGTKAMRNAASKYLPKWTNESPNEYDYRLKTTFLFNAFGHTVAGLGGKPFVRPVSWTKDTPDEIVSWFPNIDLTGRSLHVFAQEVFTTALAYGLTHVLVDYPRTDGIVTRAQEKAANVRPYLVHINPTSILGWRSDSSSGVEVLTQLRVLETVQEDDGPFATKAVEQVCVYEPGKWSQYRMRTVKVSSRKTVIEWYLYDSGTTTFDTIPLITFYTKRTGFMTAESPLIDIADLNIQHWQVASDMNSILHTASVPILTLIGIERNDEGSAPVTVGAKSALMLPEGASAKFTEHTGKAVDAGRTALQDIEERMRLLGAEMLVKKPGQATATQATLDTSQQRSELQSLTGIFEDTLDQVIAVMAQWANITGDLGNMLVYKDFLLAADDAVQEALLFSITTAGLLSPQSFYEQMQRRDVYYTDATWEQEQERIAAQPLPAPATLQPKQALTPKAVSSGTIAQLND
jgi:hypothetical protein